MDSKHWINIQHISLRIQCVCDVKGHCSSASSRHNDSHCFIRIVQKHPEKVQISFMNTEWHWFHQVWWMQVHRLDWMTEAVQKAAVLCTDPKWSPSSQTRGDTEATASNYVSFLFIWLHWEDPPLDINNKVCPAKWPFSMFCILSGLHQQMRPRRWETLLSVNLFLVAVTRVGRLLPASIRLY